MAKKTIAKKATAKTATTKKANAKKATAKTATAKKATAKKVVAKAATAKKATAKTATTAIAKKATLKATSIKKSTVKVAPKKKSARKPNAAFMKPLNPSKELAEIVGGSPIPRTEVMKKVWLYIKKHDLQDAKNRRAINADDKLKAVFGGKKQVTMFEMTKLVSNHLK